MSHVLIVDDEPSICWALRECLTDEGLSVDVAGSAEQALDMTAQLSPDVILMDVRLPGMDGLTAMQQLRSSHADVPVIVMTAFGSLSTAVRAVDHGAFDYLVKPLDLDRAVAAVRQALDSSPAIARKSGDDESDELIGRSPAMQSVFHRIALVAEHDVPVLITGESGTGKDVVARAIHQHSRRSGAFVPICIPALSETVLESELFGHVRGAFTGAEVERRGLLSLADRGTAFVDEIGDVPLNLQAKLLRALETREIRPVGGSTAQTSAFRLIAATNQPLEQRVEVRAFRSDLFFRLNVFRIEIPPLRERTEDVADLAERFLHRSGPRGRGLRFADSTLAALIARPWPGNVRELRNAIEHAVVVCRGDIILPEHLPSVSTSRSERPLDSLEQAVGRWATVRLQLPDAEQHSLHEQFLAEAESALFDAVLVACDGNRSLAARRLGIHRETLREKLKRRSGADVGGESK